MNKKELSWILYDVGNSAYTLIITTAIFPVFFKTYVAADLDDATSTAYLGYANSIALLLIAFIAPIMGTLADQRGYKKKLFVLFLSLGLGATVALTLVDAGDIYFSLIVYAITSIGFYAAVVFYDAFLVDTTTEARSDWISSSGFAWGYLGSLLPFALCLGLILGHAAFGLDSSLPMTRLAFIITAVWWLAFSVPLMRNVQQQYGVAPSPNPVRASFVQLGHTFRNIRQYREVVLFLAAFFLYIDGVHTIIKMAAPFGLDLGLDSQTLLIVIAVVQLVGFPSALIYGALAKRFGTKPLLLFGVGTYMFITLLAYFMYEPWHFWVLGILVGTAQGGVQALSRSYFSRIIPKEHAGEFFGFYDIFGKFAAILGPAMVGVIAHYTGNSQSGVLSLIVLFIAGGALLLFVREERSAGTSEAA